MNFEKRYKKDGTAFYLVSNRFTDPLTGKRKRVSVSFKSNTPRAKNQAIRELDQKIADKLAELQGTQKEKRETYTFGELRRDWFDTWEPTVKPQTVKREKLVIRRLSKIIKDDILVKNITPLLLKKCLDRYKEDYEAAFTSMQHIKSTLNKIFDYAVLYNYLPFSPAQNVKMATPIADKVAKKERLEQKFLDEREVRVLIQELRKRRNPAYYELFLFLIGTGCRIGEAGALTVDDVDFDRRLVSIQKSLQTHDLRVDDYYQDTPKTAAGERIEELPEFSIAAIKRCIQRNKAIDASHKETPSDAYHFSEAIFRTEYGSPISSHAFREVLGRINVYLCKHCETVYGFKWTKNAVPHSFRHIHISVLRNDPSMELKEVQERVGHVMEETTANYTHLLTHSQKKSVSVISKFAKEVGID